MRLLAVDIGNSHLKATLLTDGSAPELVCRVATSEAMSVVDLLVGIASECIVCGVGTDVGEFVEALRADGMNVMVFDHATPLPIMTNYDCYTQLGLDRVATACGVLSYIKEFDECDFVVADAGTALTLDYVTSANGCLTFEGGNISAGIGLRLKSLHEYTHLLPSLTPDDAAKAMAYDSYINKVSYGKTTVSAMACGAICGMQNEIVGFVDAVGNNARPKTLILTGGDAPKLLNGNYNEYLKHNSGYFEPEQLQIIYSPHLLTLGLREIYYYNR